MISKLERLLSEMGDSVLTPNEMGTVVGGYKNAGPTYYKSHENTDMDGDGCSDDCAYEEDAASDTTGTDTIPT